MTTHAVPEGYSWASQTTPETLCGLTPIEAVTAVSYPMFIREDSLVPPGVPGIDCEKCLAVMAAKRRDVRVPNCTVIVDGKEYDEEAIRALEVRRLVHANSVTVNGIPYNEAAILALTERIGHLAAQSADARAVAMLAEDRRAAAEAKLTEIRTDAERFLAHFIPETLAWDER
jgi:hypothetical protein